MQLIQGKKIWDLSRIPDRKQTRLEHPDLIHYKGYWYCAIQESPTHNQHPDTRGRIIRSADGEHWESVDLYTWQGGAAVTGGFTITAEGQLMACANVYFVSREPRFDQYRPRGEKDKSYTPPEARATEDRPGSYYQLDWIGTTLNLPLDDQERNVTLQSGTRFSSDGLNWSSVYACTNGINTQRYFPTWHNGMCYAVGQHGKDHKGTLYRTRDGKTWRTLVENFAPKGLSNETALAFGLDNTGYALTRGPDRDGVMLGIGKAPYYQQWEWKDVMVDYGPEFGPLPAEKALRFGLGGPRLIRLSDGRLVAVGRALGPGRDDGRVTLFLLDPKRALMTMFAEMDGTSYPGLVELDGMLWVTFVSSLCHKNIWEVHLAKIPLPA